jgi:hypothetical protein
MGGDGIQILRDSNRAVRCWWPMGRGSGRAGRTKRMGRDGIQILRDSNRAVRCWWWGGVPEGWGGGFAREACTLPFLSSSEHSRHRTRPPREPVKNSLQLFTTVRIHELSDPNHPMSSLLQATMNRNMMPNITR